MFESTLRAEGNEFGTGKREAVSRCRKRGCKETEIHSQRAIWGK